MADTILTCETGFRVGRWRGAATWRLGLGLAVLALAAVAAGLFWWWLSQGTFAKQVERQVRAEVPIGTPRADVEAWIKQAYGSLPTYHADVTANRIQGRTIPQCAGVNEDELGGMVMATVVRRSSVGRAISHLYPDHVWVYFFLDHDGRVSGYFFFSFEELRELEATERRRENEQPR